LAFTRRAIDRFARHGVAVKRIMTDNGFAYCSHALGDLLRQRDVTHKHPRYRCQAERFIRTTLRGPQPFQTSAERATVLLPLNRLLNATGRFRRSRASRRLAASSVSSAYVATRLPDTSGLTPGVVGMVGVKPRASTAAGGLALLPARSIAEAHSPLDLSLSLAIRSCRPYRFAHDEVRVHGWCGQWCGQ
jgi:hypothetical protein